MSLELVVAQVVKPIGISGIYVVIIRNMGQSWITMSVKISTWASFSHKIVPRLDFQVRFRSHTPWANSMPPTMMIVLVVYHQKTLFSRPFLHNRSKWTKKTRFHLPLDHQLTVAPRTSPPKQSATTVPMQWWRRIRCLLLPPTWCEHLMSRCHRARTGAVAVVAWCDFVRSSSSSSSSSSIRGTSRHNSDPTTCLDTDARALVTTTILVARHRLETFLERHHQIVIPVLVPPITTLTIDWANERF
jgi:hypothetical protein